MTSDDLRELEIAERIEQDIEGRKLEEERIMTGYKRKLCSNGCCVECDACAAKPGTPVLCAVCLHRRYICMEKHSLNSDREAESEVTAAQALADAARWTTPLTSQEAAKIAVERQGDPAELLDRCIELVDRIPDAAPKQKRLVFDIETAALPNAAEYLEPVEPPSNYRDPAVIARWQADKQREQLDRAALDPDLCRIVAVGALEEGKDVPFMETTQCSSEEQLLDHFWVVVRHYHLVGYNCLAFDLPVLVRRSQYLGVPVPKLDLSKYKSQEHVTDLMQVLSFNGVQKYRSLNWYCKRWGIDVPDLLTGADIAGAVAAGNLSAVENHLSADLRKTAALAGKLGLFAEVQ